MAAIGAIAGLVGSGIQAIGAIQQGKAQQAALDFEAKQREQKAMEERAAAQRSMLEKRDEGKKVMSRQVALAASSGGGVVNPSILDIYGETAQEAEYNAEIEKYGGESRARGEIDQANLARARGKAAMRGSVFEGIGTALGGISKLNFG